MYLIIYKFIFTYLDTMIILLLLLAILHHNGMTATKEYEEVEKSLLLKLGKVNTYLRLLSVWIFLSHHFYA